VESNVRDGRFSPAQNLQVITIHNYLCCMGVMCTWVKLLTDLQILGCEVHKNAFGGRALTEPAGEAIVLPRPSAARTR